MQDDAGAHEGMQCAMCCWMHLRVRCLRGLHAVRPRGAEGQRSACRVFNSVVQTRSNGQSSAGRTSWSSCFTWWYGSIGSTIWHVMVLPCPPSMVLSRTVTGRVVMEV